MDNKKIEKFNKKNNLGNIDNSLFAKKQQHSQVTAELSGKLTTTTREVIKRFLHNPLNVIAVIVIIAIILMAIIVTYTSMYDPNKAISNVQVSLITNLPPRTFGDFVTQNLNNTQLLGLDKSGIWIDGISTWPKPSDPKNILTILGRNVDGSFNVSWDPWNYIDKVSGTHHASWAGTTSTGKDIWTQVWFGTWSSLLLAFSVGIIQMILGVSIGAYIGYHAGGLIDLFMMRLVNVINMVPPLIWLIVLVFVLPNSLGWWTMFISLIVIGFLVPVYYTRLYVLKIKDSQFIKASHAVGASEGRLIFSHALPNVLGKLSVLFVRRIPIIILLQTTLAFMGLSPNPGEVSLGSIINDAKSHMDLWWYIALPISILTLITLSLQIISNGLHDAFDPKSIRVRA